MLPVGIAWKRLNVSPKITSHSTGCTARVSTSVRSWRSFCSSTRQNVADAAREAGARVAARRWRRVSRRGVLSCECVRISRSPPLRFGRRRRDVSPVKCGTRPRASRRGRASLQLLGRAPRLGCARGASARPGRRARRPPPCSGWSAARSCRSPRAAPRPAARRCLGRPGPARRSARRAPAAAGRLTSACASSSRRTIPPEYVAGQAVGGVGEPHHLERLGDALLAFASRHVEEAREPADVLASRQRRLDRELLRHVAEAATHRHRSPCARRSRTPRSPLPGAAGVC